MAFHVHPAGICESASVGDGTRIAAFTRVLPGAVIGKGCEIRDFVLVESDVVLGDRVTVSCGVQLWDGLRVQDDVFLGANATFGNEPRGPGESDRAAVRRTQIDSGATIGANSVVLQGVRVGAKAVVEPGSVVTLDVPPYAIVAGNPARIVGYAETLSRPPDTAPARLDPSRPPVEDLRVPGVRLYRFPEVEDLRGNLTFTDMEHGLPFTPRRYFLVFSVNDQRIRGEHAHRACEQFLVCASGTVHLIVDDGERREEIVLNRQSEGVYVPPMIWATQCRFTPDAVLLVFASHPYDPDDYIRNYDDFLAARRAVAGS